jgi:hypothetical protein
VAEEATADEEATIAIEDLMIVVVTGAEDVVRACLLDRESFRTIFVADV